MAKVLIDISEEDYKRGTVMASAIRNGIVLDGLTNGEVFLKMHPNFRVVQSGMVSVTIKDEFDNETDFSLEWWNRKWGE